MTSPAINEVFHIITGSDDSHVAKGFWARCAASEVEAQIRACTKPGTGRHLRLVSNRDDGSEVRFD